MEVTATTKFVRISPRKARDLARAISGKPVSEALMLVASSRRKAAVEIGKTLKSAVANAENNSGLTVEKLVVREAVVEDGPRLKRWRPRARGMASVILKRMSHIRITLTDGAE